MKTYKKSLLVFLLLIGSMFASYSQVMEAPPRDGVFDKSAIFELQAIPYVYLREADIVWTKRIWRVIDLREKMNLPYYYPLTSIGNLKNLIQVLLDAINEGTLTAYAAGNDDQFLLPMTNKEVNDKLEPSVLRTLKREDGTEYEDYVKTPFRSEDVKKFLIKEDWFFDKQRSVFEVRILGISPLKSSFDPTTGEPRAEEQPFWIYFPEARDILAHAEIFNMKNGSAGRLSYDDAFTKRIFSSYITQTENVYNRRINQYAIGVDALLESERAKNQIFEFEEGLWEY